MIKHKEICCYIEFLLTNMAINSRQSFCRISLYIVTIDFAVLSVICFFRDISGLKLLRLLSNKKDGIFNFICEFFQSIEKDYSKRRAQ